MTFCLYLLVTTDAPFGPGNPLSPGGPFLPSLPSRPEKYIACKYLLLASLSEPAHYLSGSAVLLDMKGVKNRVFLSDRFCACGVSLFIK